MISVFGCASLFFFAPEKEREEKGFSCAINPVREAAQCAAQRWRETPPYQHRSAILALQTQPVLGHALISPGRVEASHNPCLSAFDPLIGTQHNAAYTSAYVSIALLQNLKSAFLKKKSKSSYRSLLTFLQYSYAIMTTSQIHVHSFLV
jgi:hypothetical protein